MTPGYLTTAAELDREVQAEYKLLVHAVDGGGLSCTTEVYVAVKDVNDNAPVFTMETYTVTIAESAKVNTLITRVSASDEDLGKPCPVSLSQQVIKMYTSGK